MNLTLNQRTKEKSVSQFSSLNGLTSVNKNKKFLIEFLCFPGRFSLMKSNDCQEIFFSFG